MHVSKKLKTYRYPWCECLSYEIKVHFVKFGYELANSLDCIEE
jgi:hypothetical protein